MKEIQRAQQNERDAILAALWELRLAIAQDKHGRWIITDHSKFHEAAAGADTLLTHIRGAAHTQHQGTAELALTVTRAPAA